MVDGTGLRFLDSIVEGDMGKVRVRFWQCLVPEHREPDEGRSQTVAWVGDVAHCTHPNCELTSEHTDRFAQLIREVVERQLGEAEQWEPGRWWRVRETDGMLWCETSSEQEARTEIKPGRRLERLYQTVTKYEWRPA